MRSGTIEPSVARCGAVGGGAGGDMRTASEAVTVPLNVLLITTDQQHAETLGCMGNPAIRTPNIDAIAREGVVFT